MSSLAKHVKTTEAGNRIFLENASSTDGINERTSGGRLFSPGHSIGIDMIVEARLRDNITVMHLK